MLHLKAFRLILDDSLARSDSRPPLIATTFVISNDESYLFICFQTGFYPNTDTQFVPSGGNGPKTQGGLGKSDCACEYRLNAQLRDRAREDSAIDGGQPGPARQAAGQSRPVATRFSCI